MKELQERVEKCRKAYNMKADAIHYANVKAEFVGCKACGSRIARKYLKTNYCPVCHKDLRPQSTLESIANAKVALQKAEAQYKEAVKAQQLKYVNQAKIKWLIKFEYHM